MPLPTETFLKILRCPGCQARLSFEPHLSDTEQYLSCYSCKERFPVIGGIPRLLLPPLREAILGNGLAAGTDQSQVKTAMSFGFEWSRFPEMYEEWNDSFLKYMQPHTPEFFEGKKVLDAGCGSGRFAYYAAKYGAEVWAIDLSSAVNVAQRNTKDVDRAYVIQADLHSPPFAFESFDFIYSIGVLHHLKDPEGAFRGLLRFLKPGGEVQIYLYWKPENQPVKKALLAVVSGVRQITTRLPHSIVHLLAFPER